MIGIGLLFGISGIKAQNFERSVAIFEINNEQTGKLATRIQPRHYLSGIWRRLPMFQSINFSMLIRLFYTPIIPILLVVPPQYHMT